MKILIFFSVGLVDDNINNLFSKMNEIPLLEDVEI